MFYREVASLIWYAWKTRNMRRFFWDVLHDWSGYEKIELGWAQKDPPRIRYMTTKPKL